MTTLITAVEEHHVQLEREMQEEVGVCVCVCVSMCHVHKIVVIILLPNALILQQDRIAREFMIAEQNRAYQESLDADREKVVKCYCASVNDDLYQKRYVLFRRGRD